MLSEYWAKRFWMRAALLAVVKPVKGPRIGRPDGREERSTWEGKLLELEEEGGGDA